MSVKHISRALVLGLVLFGGSILGMPMRPEEIEELMACMHLPKIEVTVDETDHGEELIPPVFRK